MFPKQAIFIYILSITIVLVLSYQDSHRDKKGRISTRAVKPGAAPSNRAGYSPSASGSDASLEFTPFADIDGRKYLLNSELVSNNVARQKCEKIKQQGGFTTEHHSILVLETEEEKEKFLQKYNDKGESRPSCIWTGTLVNVKKDEIRVHIPHGRGRRIKIIPMNDKSNKEIPLRARVNSMNVTHSPPPGINYTDTSPDHFGRYISVSQTVFPWIEVLSNGTICEYLETSCKPRQCTLITPPCEAAEEQICTIKKEANCITVPDASSANGTSSCEASCDECSVEQPNCVVQVEPCVMEEDRKCQIQAPDCTALTPECTVELEACTTYQPPCNASHPYRTKDCLFGEKCFVKAGKEGETVCKKIKRPGPCPKEEPNCSPYVDVCEIARVCARPQFCRPPVIHCPNPESFCPPPKITCPPPEVSCGQPNITCNEPKVFCPPPSVLCTQPRINCTAPQISCPVVTTSCSNPELDCQPVNVKCPSPVLQCEAYTECESFPGVPPTTPIDICIKETCDNNCSCSKVTKSKMNPNIMTEEFGDCSEKCATVCEG